MREVLEFIDQKAREMADAPIMHFLRDKRLDPRQRFSFVPCLAPWVFGFADLNTFVLRDDASKDALQQQLNTHAAEDDFHWQMYMQDLQTLGMNDVLDFASTLKLLWGAETTRTRRLVHELAGLITPADPVMRMVIVKAIEETSHLSFKEAFHVAAEFRELTGQPLHFFGDSHLEMEGDHSMREEEAEAQFRAIQLTPERRQQALAAVEKVFQLVRGMTDEMMEYAQRHPRPMPLPAPVAKAR